MRETSHLYEDGALIVHLIFDVVEIAPAVGDNVHFHVKSAISVEVVRHEKTPTAPGKVFACRVSTLEGNGGGQHALEALVHRHCAIESLLACVVGVLKTNTSSCDRAHLECVAKEDSDWDLNGIDGSSSESAHGNRSVVLVHDQIGMLELFIRAPVTMTGWVP